VKEVNSAKIIDFHIIKRLYGFIQPYRFRFWFLVFLILCMAGISPVVPLLIRYTLDHYLGLTFQSDLFRMLGWMLGALLLQTFLQFSTSYLAGYLGQTVIRDIRIQLYEKIVNLR